MNIDGAGATPEEAAARVEYLNGPPTSKHGAMRAASSWCAPSALELATAFRPDVAFLNIGLPVMDGCALAVRFRQIPGLEDVRLVALPGCGQESELRRTRETGFHHASIIKAGQVTSNGVCGCAMASAATKLIAVVRRFNQRVPTASRMKTAAYADTGRSSGTEMAWPGISQAWPLWRPSCACPDAPVPIDARPRCSG